MAYHLPPLQPVWSFIAPASLPHMSPDVNFASLRVAEPVQEWSIAPDGRPRMRWAIARRTPPEG